MPSRLNEIRKRSESIVPGPWRWMGNTATDQVYLGTAHSGRLIIISPAVQPSETVFRTGPCSPGGSPAPSCRCGENPGGDLYREDFLRRRPPWLFATPEAEFIERAAEDVPYLLSLIDAYKALASALNRHPNSQESDDARERVSRLENQ